MNIFDVPEAAYYCKGFHSVGGHSGGSLRKYIDGPLTGAVSLKEGTPAFDNYRDCALRDVERAWFLAVSNYRRAFDLMIPGAVSWAHVTLYYSSYFAATALLGMFGGSIHGDTVIDVATSKPGNQELLVSRKVRSTYNGPHRRFWDFFYGATTSLIPWVDLRHRIAITPVSNLITWQIDKRNDTNYDSFLAFQMASSFQSGFRIRDFTRTLPGALSTQFVVTEALLLLTSRFIRKFRLSTDVFNSLLPLGTRKRKIHALIFRARAPKLSRKRKWNSLTI